MSVNKHIAENLEYYISSKNPEYAFLLTGGWGTGKTYFIESYIEEYNKPNKSRKSKIKIIKISLFGLRNTSSIDERIFQQLHPFLSHKVSRFAGNLLKAGLKMGIKCDFDDDKRKDGDVSVSLEKVNFSEIISKGGNIILVLDDLERTDIPLKEILGYINYLVEASKIKVIIIANEDKLVPADDSTIAKKSSEDNDGFIPDKTYKEFKEKVIGKTFEVKNDFDEALEHFLKDPAFKNLKSYKETIKHTYLATENKNLRSVKQCILDMKFIIEKLDKKFTENKDFMTTLVNNFFVLSIDVKRGSLNEKSLRANEPLRSQNNDADKDKFLPHELVRVTPLYSGEMWANLIFKGDLEAINEETEKLIYFTAPKKNEKPLWLKLWHFSEINDEDEFNYLSTSLQEKFESLEEFHPTIYTHNLALLIYFSKNNLIKMDVDKINNLVAEYLIKHDKSTMWSLPRTYSLSYYNETGYAYYNDTDEDFKSLQRLIREKITSAASSDKINAEELEIDSLLEDLEKGNIEKINHFFFEKNNLNAIFTSFDADKFSHALLNSENSAINHIDQVLSERYLSGNTLNNKLLHLHFTEEFAFWVSVKNILDSKLGTVNGVKKHNIARLSDIRLKAIILRLKSNQ